MNDEEKNTSEIQINMLVVQNKILNEEIEVVPKNNLRKSAYLFLNSNIMNDLLNLSFYINFFYFGLNSETNSKFLFNVLKIISASSTVFYTFEILLEFFAHDFKKFFKSYSSFFQLIITISFQLNFIFEFLEIKKNEINRVLLFISFIRIFVLVR